jgi:CHAD domain-containing protein
VQDIDDIEGVHRMRVATRRLRAALRVFEAALPSEAGSVRAELTWLGQTLGTVRDLDVQLATLRTLMQDAPLQAVVDILEARRAPAHQALRRALASPRYAALVAQLQALRGSPGSQALAKEEVPNLVRRSQRRFRHTAREAEQRATAARLHRARIRAKQLRYSLEFVADLYGPPADELIAAVTRVQDVLGTIQDAATMHQQLNELSDQVPADAARIIRRHYDRQAAKARKEAPQAMRRVLGKRWRRLRRAL